MRQEVYLKLSYDGSHCIMNFNEGMDMLKDAETDYEVDTVMMTRDQFEALPEFTGF